MRKNFREEEGLIEHLEREGGSRGEYKKKWRSQAKHPVNIKRKWYEKGYIQYFYKIFLQSVPL